MVKRSHTAFRRKKRKRSSDHPCTPRHAKPNSAKLQCSGFCVKAALASVSQEVSSQSSGTHREAVSGDSEGAYEVHSVGLQHARYLHAHLRDVRGRSLAAEHRVKGTLIHDRVEGLIGVLQGADVHHLPDESWLVPDTRRGGEAGRKAR